MISTHWPLGLQFLVRLHKDMGLPETDEYLSRLKKAEKIREVREQRVISASSRQPLSTGVFGQPSESLDSISGGISILFILMVSNVKFN